MRFFAKYGADNMKGARRVAGLIVIIAIIMLFTCALAETSLTVDLKGASTGGIGVWRTAALTARFDVWAGEGDNAQLLGQVTANPLGEESDTVSFPDELAGSVYLMPHPEDFEGLYDCAGPITLTLTAGQHNPVSVLAYARQGYFAVESYIDSASGRAAAGAAEFVILDGRDNAVFSFMTDENGLYTLQSPMPTGEYQLVQMIAPVDSLPTESAIPFSISPYYGLDGDIAHIEVVNEGAPIENRARSRLNPVWDRELDAFFLKAREASLHVAGVMDGNNTVELHELMVSLDTPNMVMEGGGRRADEGSVTLKSITISLSDPSCMGIAQLLSTHGEPISTPITLVSTARQDVSSFNASGVTISFVNGSGEAVVPAGFAVNDVNAEYTFSPYEAVSGDASITGVEVPVSVNYSFSYPNNDGMSLVTVNDNESSALGLINVNDGRSVLAVSLETTSLDGEDSFIVSIDTGASRNLPDAMTAVLTLPRGARLNESALPQGCKLLRLETGDAVLLDIGALLSQSLTLPARDIGEGDIATLHALDPMALPKTSDNPKGLSVLAEQTESDALLSLFTGADADARFAVIPCSYIAPVAGGSQHNITELLHGVIFEDSDLDGKRSEGENAPALEGVLVTGDDNVYYGAYTREDGTFSVYGLEGALPLSGTLTASLPRSTASTEGREGVVSMPDIALDSANEIFIGYTQLCSIEGTVTLSGGEGVSDVAVTLYKDGSEIASAVTDPAGFYTFDGLMVDSGYEITASLPADREMALLAPDGAQWGQTVTTKPFALSYGEDKAMPFTATKLCSLAVYLFESEQPLSGVALTLRSGANVLEGVAGEDGQWLVRGLYEGEYELTVLPVASKALARLDGESVMTCEAYTKAITLAQGENKTIEAVFEPTASLQGAAPALGEGHFITAASLYDQFTTLTDSQGNYRFDGLPGGDYTIYAPLPSGRAVPDDSLWRVTQQGDMIWLTVSIQAGNIYQMPEATFSLMTGLKGMAYLDLDGSGAYTAGDSPLSGVTVTLDKDEGGEWRQIASANTDEYGAYSFMMLDPGSYRVCCGMTGGLFASSIGGSTAWLEDTQRIASSAVTLSEGDVITSGYDVALGSPATLQLSAFLDSNQNGKRGNNEKGVSGITVSVMGTASDGSDIALWQATTGEDGVATVQGVRPGTYMVRFSLPSGYLFSKRGEGMNAVNSLTERSDEAWQDAGPVTLLPGETASVGVGVASAGSLSGKVWSDDNSNGVMDEDESGLAGVTITVTGKRTGSVFTYVTDDTGLYLFDRLRGDTYVVTAELPEGMLFARYTKTGGDLRSIITTAGVSKGSREFTVEAGKHVRNKNIGVICEGGITGTAFYDLNYNGQLDEGEPGYAGVTVEIIKNSNNDSQGKSVTDESGRFAVTGLRGGDYRVRAVLPNDGSFFSVVPDVIGEKSNQFVFREGRRENSLASLEIGNGETRSAYIGVARGAKLLGAAFVDADYNGNMDGGEKMASGLSVLLRNDEGILVSQTSTNAKGLYAFDDVMPGVYTLYIERREGYAFTRYNEGGGASASKTQYMQDGYGIIPDITVTMGNDISGLNAGMLLSGTISGVVYSDESDSGAREDGEPGLAGVTVRLVSTDMDRNPVDLTAMTSDTGAFLLDGVMPGSYDMTYILPEHVEFAGTRDASRERTIRIDGMKAGENREVDTVGAVVLGSFIGTAFNDVNANGVMDEGEAPLSDVIVTFAQNKGEKYSTTTSDDGSFYMTALRPAQYNLNIELPPGYIFSCDITSSRLDAGTEQVLDISCPWEALISREPVALGAVMPAELNGFLGLDENRNGRQDEGEVMLGGITYELYDEGKGEVVKTMTSADDGQIRFTNVRPATYTLRFNMPAESELIASDSSLFKLSGSVAEQKGIALSQGEIRSDIYGVLAVRASISGLVRLDRGGSLAPLAGVTVTLYRSSGEMVASALTDESGAYVFSGLWPDDYVISAKQPHGMLFVSVEDERFARGLSVITSQDGDTGRSDNLALKMAIDQLDRHITFVMPGMVGDYAWLDENGNGLNDMTELPISGVKVELIRNGEIVYQTVTDASGYYLFDGVYPGEYVLRASTYSELDVTKRVSGMPILTTCLTSGDGSLAESDVFTVSSGMKYFDFDLGYTVKQGKKKPDGIKQGPSQDWSVSNNK